jgi:hypothetical protein
MIHPGRAAPGLVAGSGPGLELVHTPLYPEDQAQNSALGVCADGFLIAPSLDGRLCRPLYPNSDRRTGVLDRQLSARTGSWPVSHPLAARPQSV